VIGFDFSDFGFVGFLVMGLGVSSGPVWLILCLVVGFV
jgi:hypothetical protein